MIKIFFLLFFLGHPLWAAPSGQWTGTGFAETVKKKWDCQLIEMRLLESENKLILRGGGYACGELQAEYPYSIFLLENGKVIYEGDEVGEYTDKTLHLRYDGGQYNLWLKVQENGQLFYRELWADRQDFLWIEGILNSF